MAVVEWNDVVTKLPAPELSTVPAPAQEDILEFVHETLSVAALGGESSARLRRARMLLAAHIATVTKPAGFVAGPVTSESTSKIARSYAMLMTGNWSGSAYGQEFTRLVRNAPGARLPRVF